MAGDELALLDAFDRTGDLVFCAALLMSGQDTTAEDLTEALFVEFWRAPETFAPTDGPLGLQMIRRLAALVAADPGAASTPPGRAPAGRAE